MTYITDWQDNGAWPVQDFQDGVPVHMRMMMTGVRISKVSDPGDASGDGMVEYARDQQTQLGTIADIHPWNLWMTADTGRRGIGMFSMAFAALSAIGGGGGFGRGNTGHKVEATGLLPIRIGDVSTDSRFVYKYPGWPKCFPSIPKGVMMMVMPATWEKAQHEVMLHADPRMVAVNREGPAEAGTLVVDLQPEGEMCMRGSRNPQKPGQEPDDAKEPGIVGRAARLQSMMRVVPLSVASLAGIEGMGTGNAIAWNLAPAGVDKIAGLGLCWLRMSSGGGKPGGPITQPPGSGGNTGGPTPGPITQPPGKRNASLLGGGGGGGGGGTQAAGLGGDSPCGFGEFRPVKEKAFGSTFMAAIGPAGPFTGGSGLGDKHLFGTDKDGNPITSGHISTRAYYHEGEDRDGPFMYEGEYPNPPPLPLITKVHLSWDPGQMHPWPGGQREGKWRWWGETNVCCPDEPGEPPVVGPNTGGPNTPGPTTPTGPTPNNPNNPGRPNPVPGPITPSRGLNFKPQTGSGPITHGRGVPAPPGPWRGRTYTGSPTAPGAPMPGGPGRPSPPGPTTGGPSGRPRGPTTPRPLPGAAADGLPTQNPDDPLGPLGTGSPEGGAGGGGSELKLGRRDMRHRVGDIGANDRYLFELFHPMAEGFAQITFRPQLMVRGKRHFIHNAEVSDAEIREDERRRPQVLALRVWGGQNASGDRIYQSDPDTSRARGGTSHGGILFSPPAYELEDYLLGGARNVRTIETASFVACAPGVGFALGVPASNGGMDSKAIVIAADPADTTNDGLWIYQNNPIGIGITLLKARTDQVSGEVTMDLAGGGNQSISIPRGTTAQRPVALAPAGGDIRINTDVAASVDTPEFYDAQVAAWKQLGVGGPVSVAFTATAVFAHRHGRGRKPNVQVVDSGGTQIECCVTHTDANTVVLNFVGTITSGVLILN